MKLALTFTLAMTLAIGGGLQAREADRSEAPLADGGTVDAIVASLGGSDLRRLALDALAGNPHLSVLTATALAADQRAPQVRSLPDPTASLTVFLLQPQTRVGPQQAAAGVSQRLPWFGKLELKEKAALLDAAAAWVRIEIARLDLVTRVRNLYHELQYLDRERKIVTEDQTTLEVYEELAQARYASGIGIGQSVVKIQAEITRSRTRLLDIRRRRVALLAEINALRDRQDSTPVDLESSPFREVAALPPMSDLRDSALGARPELVEIQTLLDAAQAEIDLAEKNHRPDFSVGLNYALVGKRTDTAGRLNPPEGNGDDILGVSGGINLPIWRERLSAGVEEAIQRRLAVEQRRRTIVAEIGGDLADLARRIPLIEEQLELFDRILTVQAEESLRSAEAAYASGTASALDLLDAERVLLGVRLAAERARSDLAIAHASLEGVLATPLETIVRQGSAS